MGTKVSVNEILQEWKDLVDGVTVTLNQAEPYNKFRVILGGNRILAIVNEESGDEFLLQIGQDATGGRTVQWFSKDSTFATTDLNTTNDQIAVGRNIPTTTPLKFSSTGTLPTGLVAGTKYYAININPTTIKIATSIANAQAGTAIDFTDQGTGTHTIQTHINWPNDVEPTLSAGKYAKDNFRLVIEDGDNGIYRGFPAASSGGGGAFEDFVDQGSDPPVPISGQTRAYTKAGVFNLRRNTPGDVGLATPDAGHMVITPGANKLVKVAILYQEGEHQTAVSGPVTPVANAYTNNAIILSGWGLYVPPIGSKYASKTVAFGLTFASPPVVLTSFLGWTNGGVGGINSFNQGNNAADKSGVVNPVAIGTTQFVAELHKTESGNDGTLFLNGVNSWFGFSWIAIGVLS